MNLKSYYDAAIKAEAELQGVLQKADDLFQAGDQDAALAMRPELDEAKKKADDANSMYAMMRDSEASTGAAKNFAPANTEGNQPKEMTRAEFGRLNARAAKDYVLAGGKIIDD